MAVEMILFRKIFVAMGGKIFFLKWGINGRYSKNEAEALQLIISLLLAKRQSRNVNHFDDKKCQQNDIVDKCIKVVLSFIEVWVDINDGTASLSHSEVSFRVCQIIKKAESLGQVSGVVAKQIAAHMEFLLEETFQCSNLNIF